MDSRTFKFFPGGGFDPYNSADSKRDQVLLRLERDLENLRIDALIRHGLAKLMAAQGIRLL